MAVLGAFIYSIGINLFVVPAGLITGGMMGFCQLLRSILLTLLGIKSLSFDLTGIIYYVLNVPLFIIAYRSLGHVFFRNTLLCTTAYTVFLSIVPIPSTPIVEDVLTGCLLGGVISGVGTGIALTSGCCGGGLDIIGLYMSKKGVKITACVWRTLAILQCLTVFSCLVDFFLRYFGLKVYSFKIYLICAGFFILRNTVFNSFCTPFGFAHAAHLR